MIHYNKDLLRQETQKDHPTITNIYYYDKTPIMMNVLTGWNRREQEKIHLEIERLFPGFEATHENWYDNHGRGWGLLHEEEKMKFINVSKTLKDGNHILTHLAGTDDSPYWFVWMINMKNSTQYPKFQTNCFRYCYSFASHKFIDYGPYPKEFANELGELMKGL